jgi:hypothetical protein
MEIRKGMLIRIIDSGATGLEKEKSLIKELGEYFGKAFCHKMQMVISEVEKREEIQSKEVLSTIMPPSVWINELYNPLKTIILHPKLK